MTNPSLVSPFYSFLLLQLTDQSKTNASAGSTCHQDGVDDQTSFWADVDVLMTILVFISIVIQLTSPPLRICRMKPSHSFCYVCFCPHSPHGPHGHQGHHGLHQHQQHHPTDKPALAHWPTELGLSPRIARSQLGGTSVVLENLENIIMMLKRLKKLWFVMRKIWPRWWKYDHDVKMSLFMICSPWFAW